MIIEHTYDNRKICNHCFWLKMKDDCFGICECPDNRVKNRERFVTDKKCSRKKTIWEDGVMFDELR